MAVTTLQSGRGSGSTLLVNDDGDAHVSLEKVADDVVLTVQAGDDPVQVATTASTPSVSHVAITTPSGEVIDERPNRRWLEIQNRGPQNVFLRLGGDDATTDDRLVVPGESYRI